MRRHMYRHRLAATTLLGVAALTVAACTSSLPSSSPQVGGAQTPAAPPGSAGAADNAASTSACSNVPSTMVGKALNIQTGKLIATAEGPVTICAYQGRYEVLIRYQNGETAAEFAQAGSSQANPHQTVAGVSGLGDDAYTATDTGTKPTLLTLGARHGDVAIFITSPASYGAERTLMTHLLAKV
jgi:hypothetical protein